MGEGSALPAVKVERINPANGAVGTMPPSMYIVKIEGRRLVISRPTDPNDPALPAGRYRVTPERIGTSRLLCSILEPSLEIPVRPLQLNEHEYECYLRNECVGTCPCGLYCFLADWDLDGDVDSDDIIAYGDDAENGNADLDFDGDTDSDDNNLFFCYWDAGGC